jgi:hypothetical protein
MESSNSKPEAVVERLEWIDIDGQLYKLLRRQYPFLYMSQPVIIKRKM